MAHILNNPVYHIIFSIKNRESMIFLEMCHELHRYIDGIINRQGGFLLQIIGMPDYIHMVVKRKPVEIMQKIKCGTTLRTATDRVCFLG